MKETKEEKEPEEPQKQPKKNENKKKKDKKNTKDGKEFSLGDDWAGEPNHQLAFAGAVLAILGAWAYDVFNENSGIS